MKTITVYDTTLRDGTQGEGVSFSLQDKIDIARRLDDLGVDYIEAGYPVSNPKDEAVFDAFRNEPLRCAVPVAFGMTRRVGVEAAADATLQGLLAAETEAVAVVGKAWDFHVTKVLRTDLEENLAMVRDSVAFLKGAGRTVFFDAEHYFDGHKADAQYALRVLGAALEAGADWLILCDTNGGCLPEAIEATVAATIGAVGGAFGIHCHNDAGLAVANTLAAVRAGCTQVQGTINGLGERCGNADLCAVLPGLELKMGRECLGPTGLARLTDASRFVYDLANMLMVPGQPYVGPSAFSHKGGMHVSAVARERGSYEHVDPALVGNTRRILVSELSGHGTILAKVAGTQFEQDADLQNTVLGEVQRLENAGYQFESAEASFALLVRRLAGMAEPFFELDHYNVVIKKDEHRDAVTEATVKLKVGQEWHHTVAEGDGPVNALDAALRKALHPAFPNLAEMSLTDYKVRVINSGAGTAAGVRVVIESRDRDEHWGTVGVSENIIDASWQALVDSIAYKLTKDREQGIGNGGQATPTATC
ncbi:MAG TPA: citramalate synthase [Phycisphaerae bacterium]|nr:citramalate synthase [Phycisphaerae bacterium]